MVRIPNSRLRKSGWLLLGLAVTWIAGCAGPVLKGRLMYTDASRPTEGDSVWVRRWGCDSCGATILKVTSDHKWEYKGGKESKTLRIWSKAAGAPPLGGDTLTFRAVTSEYETNIGTVTYQTHKDSLIVLIYEPKGAKIRPDTSKIEQPTRPPRDDR